MSLADKIRASREQWIKAGGYEFLVRRPTTVQMGRWSTEEGSGFVCKCVVDWKVKEHEIVAGGGGAVPPFDVEAFREWVEDQLEVLAELATKIRELIEKHQKAQAAVEKN